MKPREKIGMIPKFIWRRVATHFFHQKLSACDSLESFSRIDGATNMSRIPRRAADAKSAPVMAIARSRYSFGAGKISG